MPRRNHSAHQSTLWSNQPDLNPPEPQSKPQPLQLLFSPRCHSFGCDRSLLLRKTRVFQLFQVSLSGCHRLTEVHQSESRKSPPSQWLQQQLTTPARLSVMFALCSASHTPCPKTMKPGKQAQNLKSLIAGRLPTIAVFRLANRVLRECFRCTCTFEAEMRVNKQRFFPNRNALTDCGKNYSR